MPSFKTDRSEKDRLPVLVPVLAIGIFLLGTTEFMTAGLLPQTAHDLGVGIPTAALQVTGFAVGMVVGTPVMAVLTLRLPRRTTLLGALGVFAAGHVAVALTSSFAVVLVARFVTAVATGTYWAVAAVVVTTSVADVARTRGLAVMVGGLTVANVVGVPLGAAVGAATSWRVPFWALAAVTVLVAVAVVAVVPDGASTGAADVRSELHAFADGRLWATLGTAALAQAAVFGTYTYVSPLLTGTAGTPPGAVPWVLTAFGVGAVVGSALGGRFGDRLAPATVTTGLLSTAALSALVALVASSAVVVVPALAVLGVSGFAVVAPLTSRAIGLAGAAPTLASASATAAFNVGNAAGPWAGGLAAGSTLGYSGPAAAGVAFAVLALLMAAAAGLVPRRVDRAPMPTSAVGVEASR